MWAPEDDWVGSRRNQSSSQLHWLRPFPTPFPLKDQPYLWLQLSQRRLGEEMSTFSKARAARIRWSLTEGGTPVSKTVFWYHFLWYWGALLGIGYESLMSWGKMMSATQPRPRISITTTPERVVGTCACPLVPLKALPWSLPWLHAIWDFWPITSFIVNGIGLLMHCSLFPFGTKSTSFHFLFRSS